MDGRRVPGSFFGSDIFHHFTQILDEWAAADPGQLAYFGEVINNPIPWRVTYVIFQITISN